MFGYRLIKEVEIEKLQKNLEEYNKIIEAQRSLIAELESKVKEDKYLCFSENFYTAPSSITGLPAVVAGGVQLVGKAFSDLKLLDLASVIEKEGK